MNREYCAYRRLFRFLKIVFMLFFKIKTVGKENIEPGPAVFCANHSSNLDPIIVSFAAGIETHLHYMGKAELFRIPILGSVLRSIGSYPVNRGHNDVSAIKNSLKYLKAGEKIAIFPEGTRVKTDEESDAKRGAVRIADQMSVPIVPVYVPRKIKPFRTYTVVFGTPYLVNPNDKNHSKADYKAAADELMEKITALKSVAG
ncbi:MAG: 1-acyl-sn-glycerol-3-phosphate acyltransferase [Clostridiales bacterium]|nr:1-acyl-sn-glycerol-3-phosphate acyltransferase [Clostridiales bacterium]